MRIGTLELGSRFTLAPLAGFTNLPFRLCVRELGGLGLATTDLVNARAVLEGSRKTMELLATVPEDRPWAIQLFGAKSDEMSAAAQWAQDYGATVVDINMGCPVRKVVRTGGGSAMMCDAVSTIALVEKIVEAVDIPVTVKMRLGWDSENLSAPYFAREFEKVGVAAVTIHGRTRAQAFTGSVDLDGIRAVVDAVDQIPVIGNGDVRSIPDAARMFQHTGCHAIAIGRGALANPWIFTQLRDWFDGVPAHPAGDYFQRLEFMRTHVRRLCEWRGEKFGCVNFRKVGKWYGKALRTGKQIQNRFCMLDSMATLEEIIAELSEKGPPHDWAPPDAATAVALPSGPIAHW